MSAANAARRGFKVNNERSMMVVLDQADTDTENVDLSVFDYWMNKRPDSR